MEFLEEPSVEDRLMRLEWFLERVIQNSAALEEGDLRRRTWAALFKAWMSGLTDFESGTESTCESTEKEKGDVE